MTLRLSFLDGLSCSRLSVAREYILDGLVFATSLWAEGSELTKALVRTIPQTATLITKVYPQGQVLLIPQPLVRAFCLLITEFVPSGRRYRQGMGRC